MTPRSRVVSVRPIDDQHQVISTETSGGGQLRHRRKPCGGCPWRIDQTGQFPAGAFEASARTAHDLSEHTFGCHESGTERPVTCAGFLLRGAEHNLKIRMAACEGRYDPGTVNDDGHELHPSYAAMSVANSVPADSEALRRCRPGPDE